MNTLSVSKCGQVHHVVRSKIMDIRQLANSLQPVAGALLIAHLIEMEAALSMCHEDRFNEVLG